MTRRKTHQWLLIVQPDAQQTFDMLSPAAKRGVFRQMRELLMADDPYTTPFVEMLKAQKFARTYKFRVGDYRIFFVVEPIPITHLKHTYKGTLFLLNILDRKEAY
ncbi:MAG: hypothetical protein U0694_18590 [Anaerolineae bacterium]